LGLKVPSSFAMIRDRGVDSELGVKLPPAKRIAVP